MKLDIVILTLMLLAAGCTTARPAPEVVQICVPSAVDPNALGVQVRICHDLVEAR